MPLEISPCLPASHVALVWQNAPKWILKGAAGWMIMTDALALSPGEPDLAMAIGLRAEAAVSSVAVQENGRVLLGGDFWWVNGTPAAGLVRLEMNGVVDGSFAPVIGLTLFPTSIFGWNLSGGVTVPPITLQPLPDGRLWVSANGLDNPWTVLGAQGSLELGALAGLPSGNATRTHAEGASGGELVVSLYSHEPEADLLMGEIRGVSLATGATLWSHTRASGVQPQRAWPSGDGQWWVAGDDLSVPAGPLLGVPGTAKQLWRIGSDGVPDVTLMPVNFERGFSQIFQPLPNGRIAVLATDYRSLQFAGASSTILPVTTSILSATGVTESAFSLVHRTANTLVAQTTRQGQLLTNLNSEPPAVRTFAEDGTEIAGFTPPALTAGNALASLPGGGFFAGAGRRLMDGTADPAWQRPSLQRPAKLHGLAPAPGGSIYVAGNLANANGSPVRSVLRLRPDGTVDPNFQLDTQVAGEVLEIHSLGDGRLYALERRPARHDGTARPRVVRLLPSGALDPTFPPYEGLEAAASAPGGQTFVGEVREIAVFADGSLLVRTYQTADAGLASHAWRGLTPAGDKDPAFKPILNPPAQALIIQADGAFWLHGQRYLRDGTRDFTLPATLSSLTPPCVLSDGRVAFKISGAGVRAVHSSGAWDPNVNVSLPAGNAVHHMVADQAGGFILEYAVPGSASTRWERYNRRGRRDFTYRAHPPTLRLAPSGTATEVIGPLGHLPAQMDQGGTVQAALVLGNGLWLAGDFTHIEGQRRDGLVRLGLVSPAGYDAWATATFRLSPPPPAEQHAEGDPDADGAVNALEYATGTDPLVSDAHESQPQLISLEPLCYSLPRNPDAPEMVPVVEVSTVLDNWRPATAADILLKGDVQAVTFQVHPTATARFFRVRFLAPP